MPLPSTVSSSSAPSAVSAAHMSPSLKEKTLDVNELKRSKVKMKEDERISSTIQPSQPSKRKKRSSSSSGPQQKKEEEAEAYGVPAIVMAREEAAYEDVAEDLYREKEAEAEEDLYKSDDEVVQLELQLQLEPARPGRLALRVEEEEEEEEEEEGKKQVLLLLLLT
jgi:hypothetical protein